MSHTVRGLPPGRVTITDYSEAPAATHHFDVAPDGSVTVATGQRLDLLLSVYPDAVASEATAPTAPPAVDEPADDGGGASATRKPRRRRTT